LPAGRSVKIHLENPKAKEEDKRMAKIKKEDKKTALSNASHSTCAAEGDIMKAFTKITKSVRIHEFLKEPTGGKKSFTDIYKICKKCVPAPTAYKYDMSVYNKLSRSPLACKVYRH
jgi:hypothetical protein